MLRELLAHNQTERSEPIDGDAGPPGPRRRGAVRQGHDGRQAASRLRSCDRVRKRDGKCEGAQVTGPLNCQTIIGWEGKGR